MKGLKYFAIICFLVFPVISWANHMLGGEVTYKYLGNKKYEVTAKVYRDCQGIPLNSPYVAASDYNGTTISISYTRTSIEDITITCSDTVSKPCKPQNNTISTDGIELHTFVGIVDFGTSPFNAFPNKNACKIYFFVNQCCRSGTITTLNPGDYYVDAMLDICTSNYQNSSPQFKSINTSIALCNVPFKQNFGGKDYVDYDSLAYNLTSALEAANTSVSYSGSFSGRYPMTPFCTTSGVINCKPNISIPFGFFIDSLNGDIIFQPSNCSQVGVIAVKISEYRKDISSNKWILVGYVIRDLQITITNVSSGPNYSPTVALSKTYNFKTRENHCIDITTNDSRASGSAANNKGDKTSLSIIEMPPGATYQYVDSSARLKTGRLCWKIHDSVYLKYKNKNKLLPLTVELRDNYCSMPVIIQKSFSIKILPPDSSGNLLINSYEDYNKNNKREPQEPGFPAVFKCKPKLYSYYTATDIDGKLKDSLGIGKVTISVASHPYYASTAKDTNLLIRMDSSHQLNFAVHQTKGIYGRIYEDANANCKFDKGEATYSGQKIFTDSNKYMGVSDNNGIYCINAPKGTYTLKCDYQPGKMTVNCPPSKTISISINGDSAYNDNNFGISKNMQYVDISTAISISRLRRGFPATVTYFCTNNSPTIQRNIKLYSPVNDNFDLKYKNVLFAGAGTTATINIDSILPYKTFSIKLDFTVATAFNRGDKICFSAKTDSATTANDSLKTNNSYKECGRVEGPYDPNEKIISIDSTRTTLDRTIDYTIHFQNSGTDTAIRIIVKDTINTQYLEMDKFRLNWSDYPCDVAITGNVIHFIFDNIRLPYLSKSGDKSIAGFNFTIGLKSDVKTETSFPNKAAIYFDFEKPIFTKDAIASIVSPIALTKLKTSGTCKNESNTVYYTSNIPLDSGNNLILEMSDANGSFVTPTILNTVTTSSSDDSMDFMIPKSTNGSNYTLRMRSTSPASVGIPFNGHINFKVLAIPGYIVSSNLINNTACEKDTIKMNFSNNSHLYKVLRNNIPLSSFNNVTSYKFPLKLKDSFKIIALDNSTGCKDTTTLYPAINKKPTISATIANRKKDYCVGDQIDLKANGGKYYTYFKNNAVLVNKTTSSTQNTTINIAAIYQIFGEDVNGCSNLSDTLNIVANPVPVAAISASINPVCSGKSISLNYGTAQNYDLYKNNVIILNKTTSPSYNINTPVDGDKYKITAFTDKGCSGNSNELTITVNPAPAANILCSPNPVCQNDTAILTYGKGFNYNLYKNNILILNKTTDTTYKIISPANGDKYKITAFSDKGCFTDGFDLTIVTKPVPAKPIISKNINTLSVNFTGSIKWYRNGILLTNTSNTITNAMSGTYIVVVTNTDGCSSSSSPFIHYHSGVNEILNSSFKVYPNPATYQLTVETDDATLAFGIKLFDMNGKLVYESKDNNSSKTIDVSEFSEGLYTLRIDNGNGNSVNRIISIYK